MGPFILKGISELVRYLPPASSVGGNAVVGCMGGCPVDPAWSSLLRFGHLNSIHTIAYSIQLRKEKT